ncbi:hypothetical protein BDW59DRAFT_56979 [Aspergillus cavernicola]|uniref:Uncharacterized protein n=1 Tax=Aspergillus cavernicola TaxID=176166 RepID=A0ABR4IJI0_9EURO
MVDGCMRGLAMQRSNTTLPPLRDDCFSFLHAIQSQTPTRTPPCRSLPTQNPLSRSNHLPYLYLS